MQSFPHQMFHAYIVHDLPRLPEFQTVPELSPSNQTFGFETDVISVLESTDDPPTKNQDVQAWKNGLTMCVIHTLLKKTGRH